MYKVSKWLEAIKFNQSLVSLLDLILDIQTIQTQKNYGVISTSQFLIIFLLSFSFKATTFGPNEEAIDIFTTNMLINANTFLSFGGSFYSWLVNCTDDGDCHHLSLGLATKARACKGAGQGWSPRVTSHAPGSVKECEGMNPHTPKWTPISGIRVPNGLPNLQRAIAGVKTHWIEAFFISLESSWNLDVWNRLAWPIWTSET
jgi:hypothetical protein